MSYPSDLYHQSNLRLDQRIKARLYEINDETLKVSDSGIVSLDGSPIHVGEAFAGSEVAIDRDSDSGLIEVRYVNVKLGEIKHEDGCKRLRQVGFYQSQHS